MSPASVEDMRNGRSRGVVEPIAVEIPLVSRNRAIRVTTTIGLECNYLIQVYIGRACRFVGEVGHRQLIDTTCPAHLHRNTLSCDIEFQIIVGDSQLHRVDARCRVGMGHG